MIKKNRKLSEQGAMTMTACVSQFEGENILSPAAFCNYQRINRIGYFADGYSGSTDSEKEQKAYDAEIRAAINIWLALEDDQRMEYEPDRAGYEAVFSDPEEAHTTTPHGQLVRGKESRSFVRRNPLVESLRVDEAKREIRCQVISEGLGNLKDKNYYGPEAIDDVARLLDGSSVFINHATEAELRERPEGDIMKKCGYWKDPEVVKLSNGKHAVHGTMCLDESDAGKEGLAKGVKAIEFKKNFPDLADEYAGISINGDGDVESREQEVGGAMMEVNYVKHVTELPSADIVTRGGRDGKFVSLMESVSGSHIKREERMNEATLKRMREALASFGTRISEKAKAKFTLEGIRKMFSESLVQVNQIAEAAGEDGGGGAGDAGGPVKDKPTGEMYEKEMDDMDEDDRKMFKAMDNGEKKKYMEMDDNEKKTYMEMRRKEQDDKKNNEMDNDKKPAAEMSDDDMKKMPKEAQAFMLAMKNRLAEATKENKSLKVGVVLAETRKQLDAAGLKEVDAKDFAALPDAARRIAISQEKKIHESLQSLPFGVGTPQRNAGSGGSRTSLAESTGLLMKSRR